MSADGLGIHEATTPTYTQEEAAAAVAKAVQLRFAPESGRSWNTYAPAIEESLAYVKKRTPDSIAVAHNDETVFWSDIQTTLERLRTLLPRLDAEPELLGAQFRWLRVTGGVNFSGYYEPQLRASVRAREGFQVPLYGKPVDLKTLNLGSFAKKFIGQRVAYRLHQGEAVPYYSREEIEDGALKGRKLEIAFVENPLDAYFLQVQGSGRLLFDNGKEQHVVFAATNGRQYTAIARLLMERGELKAPTSKQALQDWLEKNPGRARELMLQNERYVFFRLADKGPVGGMGGILTPWVSMAVDPALIPLGVPVAFAVDMPLSNGVRRVVQLGLAQDTGGAIKGHHVDVFLGSGVAAEYSAGHLNTNGTAWLLLAR